MLINEYFQMIGIWDDIYRENGRGMLEPIYVRYYLRNHSKSQSKS